MVQSATSQASTTPARKQVFPAARGSVVRRPFVLARQNKSSPRFQPKHLTRRLLAALNAAGLVLDVAGLSGTLHACHSDESLRVGRRDQHEPRVHSVVSNSSIQKSIRVR